ncbi:DUF1266 domain-containing protein [Streptomyces sp. E11-3]|uniref:DUF1266 domain-containing protein n=1 Tax=Streptomyces sp. E11-3 TaxID=3110112 RepID=UPI0039813FB2
MSFGPPPAGFGAAQSPSWTPPTSDEQALFEAKVRGDWGAYFDALARTRLFFEVRRERTDFAPGSVHPVFRSNPQTSDRWWEVFTPGMLPTPEPDRVFGSQRLRWFTEVWVPEDPPLIVVNPGSPCEAFLPAALPHTAAWAQYAKRVGEPKESGRLRALRVGGPLHGPVAHGLACGALLCVSNGSLWNAMAWHGNGYARERARLRDWWGITTREEWQHYQQQLLECEGSSPVWEFVLNVRHGIARDFGGHVDPGYWRQAAARILRERAGGVTVLSPEGVTKTEPQPEAVVEARVEGVQRLIGRITRYEARFRADGLLDENRYVSSVAAWDLGRASKMARWGLGARFCTIQEAESAVTKAGQKAALEHRSWQDFSAGYILGRCLHFDDEEFGDWYEDMLAAHRILTSEPGSPWLNIPFR